jgi:hypothetical protein
MWVSAAGILSECSNQAICSAEILEIDGSLTMAKTSAGKFGGTSRVRLVVMEAEIADGGDLTQFTQAMQSALRGPAPLAVKRIAVQASPANGGVDVAEPEAVEEAALEDVDAVDVTPAVSRAKSPRKAAPKPSVIDLDITTDPPLSSLVDPKSNHRRFLAIATWLHDHRDIEAVTADHIYTCYRHLGWPTDILDFAQPLRELKHKQFFTTPERGKYAINQLGLAKAAEVVPADAA